MHGHSHGHGHSHPCRGEDDNKALVSRLKRIEGQVRGIEGMLERDEDCSDIIIQISAAKAALHKVGLTVLKGHIEHCVVDASREDDGGKALKELNAALDQFSRMI